MTDSSLLLQALALLAAFAIGWIARSVGAPGGMRGDDIEPRGDWPLPLALRLKDKARRPGKRRWR